MVANSFVNSAKSELHFPEFSSLCGCGLISMKTAWDFTLQSKTASLRSKATIGYPAAVHFAATTCQCTLLEPEAPPVPFIMSSSVFSMPWTCWRKVTCIIKLEALRDRCDPSLFPVSPASQSAFVPNSRTYWFQWPQASTRHKGTSFPESAPSLTTTA